MFLDDKKNVETLRWRDGRLELIDQRILPARFEYVACDSAVATANAIRDMVVRGAPAIGRTAAYGVAAEALRLDEQRLEALIRLNELTEASLQRITDFALEEGDTLVLVASHRDMDRAFQLLTTGETD